MIRDFWRRLRGGKPGPAPTPPGDSPENWQVGDLAECLHDGPWFAVNFLMATMSGPRKGECRIVAGIVVKPGISQCLVFARYGMNNAFLSSPYFRKITPKADEATRADPAWVADLIGAPQPEKVT